MAGEKDRKGQAFLLASWSVGSCHDGLGGFPNGEGSLREGRLGVSPGNEMHGSMERAEARGLRRRAAESVPHIGIDEKALCKGTAMRRSNPR